MSADGTRSRLADEFVLTFPVQGLSTPVAAAKFRVWQSRRAQCETLVIATQLPQAEYDGPSVTQAVCFAIAACRARVGRHFTYIEHYNRASYGLDVYEPTFNRIQFENDPNGGIRILGNPPVSIPEICAATGLSELEVRRL